MHSSRDIELKLFIRCSQFSFLSSNKNIVEKIHDAFKSGPNIRFFLPSTAYPRGEYLGPKNVLLQGTVSNLPSTDFFRPSTDVPVGT